jgi:peptidyl-prolyl cis-trans isomerase SurA
MMRKYLYAKLKIVAFSMFVTFQYLNAQGNKDAVLMTIGSTNVTVAEFENVYRKNNKINTVDDAKPVSEYVELFVNFKLKVKEAEELGLDTSKKFVEELSGYRKQLAQPYLTDRDVNDKLLAETYSRLKEEVCVSHILIKCAETASTKDTLIAYNKIMKIYARIQKGESFEKLASQKGISDDTMLIGKAGYIGCFTALDLVYPFENRAYETKVGEISKPLRTRFGYHIIKVNDRRKAKGEISVAHIMLKNAPRMSSVDSLNQDKKIIEIYNKLKAGEGFEKLAAEFSEDKQSAANGGKLPWFGINKTPPAFENAAFSLENKGDFSQPVRSAYGVHIIKLVDRKELGAFDEVKNDLKQKLTKASRFNAGRESLINRLKKEYKYTENKEALVQIYPLIDSSFFNGSWVNKKPLVKNKTLFTLDSAVYTQNDFITYLVNNQMKRAKADVNSIVDELYKKYVDDIIIKYEDSSLEQKYPEFKALMQEYRDGILLFELTDKKVWSKAVKDTVGLKQYYENNKTKYTWGERADASVYICSDKKYADQVRKMLKKGKSEAEILKEINKSSQLNLKVETKKFNKGDNEFVDKSWVEGVSSNIISEKDNKVIIVQVKKIEQNAVKAFEETKGVVISDYQNSLEKEWIAQLKNKYVVNINKDILATIK